MRNQWKSWKDSGLEKRRKFDSRWWEWASMDIYGYSIWTRSIFCLSAGRIYMPIVDALHLQSACFPRERVLVDKSIGRSVMLRIKVSVKIFDQVFTSRPCKTQITEYPIFFFSWFVLRARRMKGICTTATRPSDAVKSSSRNVPLKALKAWIIRPVER